MFVFVCSSFTISLSISIDKNQTQFVHLRTCVLLYLVCGLIKNQMQFVHLRTCVPLYLVCGSNFLQLGSTFCRNAQRKEEKS